MINNPTKRFWVYSSIAALVLVSGSGFFLSKWYDDSRSNVRQEEINQSNALLMQIETCWSDYSIALVELGAAREKKEHYCRGSRDHSDLCMVTTEQYERLRFEAAQKRADLMFVSSSPSIVNLVTPLDVLDF